MAGAGRVEEADIFDLFIFKARACGAAEKDVIFPPQCGRFDRQ